MCCGKRLGTSHLAIKFRHTQGLPDLKRLFPLFNTFCMFLSTLNFKKIQVYFSFSMSCSPKEKQSRFLSFSS